MLADFYQQMYMIRKVEQKILESFSRGIFSGTTHTYIGQEACAVGVLNNIDREKDFVFSNHRCHGHYLVYSEGDIKGLFGELMGREIGVCKGIGGSQHMHHKNFFSSGIQGGIVPCAAGTAFAQKIRGTTSIVLSFLGDGTLGQGVVYETLNIASLWNLPVLFVVENNQYAQSTYYKHQHAGKLIDRAKCFGIAARKIRATHVMLVYEASKEAVNYVRNKSKPYFLLLETYRLGPHSKGDDHRDPKEIERYFRQDPLILLRNELDRTIVEEIESHIKNEVESAFDLALSSPRVEFKAIFRRCKCYGDIS